MRPSLLSVFIKTAPSEEVIAAGERLVTWQSPSNIALVKYWGKKYGQYPLTPSLSMTLCSAVTRTSLSSTAGQPVKGLVSVNNDPGHPFMPKMNKLLQWMAGEIPLLKTLNLTVSTENSFPHSTGIASSASGTSAFTLCLLDTVNQVTGQCISNDDLVHLASYAARMGSGSACRSLYGGYTAWGESEQLPASSDEFAIPVSSLVHPEMLTMQNAILVISAEPKEMPSTLGHKSMEDHPFLAGRIGQAEKNMNDALQALKTNDFEKLAAVAECEALTLHALMMSAHPGILLMKPATVESIHLIRKARKGGLSLFFTLDAGANVHVMYPRAAAEEVNKFICDALLPLCEDGKVIFDRCGNGPVKLTEPQHTP